MKLDALTIGRRYAFRERPRRGAASPVFKVKLLDIVAHKMQVRIRFEDGPHPGLEEYVRTQQLLAPWGERHALLRDEERHARLMEYARKVADKALEEAAGAVLESTGEVGAAASKYVTWMDERQLQRILDRAGIETAPTALHELAYRDRRGHVQLPLDAVVAVARSFAAAEPQTVVAYLDHVEEELRLAGNQPGERWQHESLRDVRPGHALARRWAGLEQEGEIQRKEIARLRILVSYAASALRTAGKDRQADQILRALEGL